MKQSMLAQVKKHHHLTELAISGVDQVSIAALLAAISYIEPSLTKRSLFMVIEQPLIGNVHTTIITMIQRGVASCRISTLLPERPDLLTADLKGHLAFCYEDGKVTDHRLPLVPDNYGDEPMAHELDIAFNIYKAEANEWMGEVSRPNLPNLVVIPGDKANR